MNVQTERLENHTARLTVEVDAPKWEAAKKNAARKLSKRYKIPGFRKGKAPYNIIARYVGEPAIVEDAMEQLGNDVYREALDASEVNPYAAGSLEDFKLEPPTYIFTVPLQPEATLGDYREIRMDYEAPEITEEDVDEALESLRQQRAETTETEAPAALGNRVTLDIHSAFADGEEEAEESDAEEADDEAESATEGEDAEEAEAEEEVSEDTDEEDEVYIPKKGEEFIHRHDLAIELREGENEPVIDGFSAKIVGASADDTVEFDIEIPDEEGYKGVVGRHVHFEVIVKKVESVVLPELNDEFAAQVTEDEDEPLTLEQLRDRLRQNLQEEATDRTESEYANKLLDAIVEQADLSYPHVMVHERIDEMVEDFGRNIAQQGIQLENYLQVMGMTRQDLEERYHEQAESSVGRSVVLGEVIVAERIRVSDADIEGQINEMLSQFGEQAEALRQFLDTPQQRVTIANNMLYEKVMKRLVLIGQGEAPDLDSLEAEEAAAAEAAASEADATVEAPVEETAEAETTESESTEDAAEEVEEAETTEDEDDVEADAADDATEDE